MEGPYGERGMAWHWRGMAGLGCAWHGWAAVLESVVQPPTVQQDMIFTSHLWYRSRIWLLCREPWWQRGRLLLVR